jgi:hypothetical protein
MIDTIPIKKGNNTLPTSTIFINTKLNKSIIIDTEKLNNNNPVNIIVSGSVISLILSDKYCREKNNNNITGKHQVNVKRLSSLLSIPKLAMFLKLHNVIIHKIKNIPIEYPATNPPDVNNIINDISITIYIINRVIDDINSDDPAIVVLYIILL